MRTFRTENAARSLRSRSQQVSNNETGSKIRVLVTGAGSELGSAVIKALRRARLPVKVLACDLRPDAAGLFLSDESFIVPSAHDEPGRYLRRLRSLCRQEHVDSIIPTSDAEILLMADRCEGFEGHGRPMIMVNRGPLVRRFWDKWFTFLWLRKHGVACPETVRGKRRGDVTDLARRCGFPLVVKPRHGGGSRGFQIIESRRQLERVLAAADSPMLVQEYIPPQAGEFTAGLFIPRHGPSQAIILKRILKFGMTYKATLVRDEPAAALCVDLARQATLQGGINIQYRLVNGKPCILEINPRFSGSCAVRSLFGFNDVEMCLRHFLLGERIPSPRLKGGTVLRYMHETFVPANRNLQLPNPPR